MTKVKKHNEQSQPRLKKKTTFVLIATLIVLASGYFIQQRMEENRESQEFVKLEEILNEFSQKVEKNLGPPAQKETTGYCARTGEKFSEGRLFCGVRTGANWHISSVSEARARGNRLKELIITEPNFVNVQEGGEIIREDEWFHDFIFKTITEKITCNLTLSYKNQNQGSLDGYVGDPKPGMFGYLVRCTNYASKEHYPMGH